MQKYDIIIIGSGLGALVCGYILSKNGYKIAVLEKNSQIGGCLQTFKRSGVKFDTGMHYIGSMDEGQILYRFFKYLNLTESVKLSRLDPDGYDTISFRGEEYKFASGFDGFTEALGCQFPENKKDIELYIQKIKEIAAASPLYNLKKVTDNVFIEADYIKTSVNDFIASVTNNNCLQNVLTGNLPLYAGIKDKTPTYIHALINNFYIQSAFRIIGGSDIIATSLVNSIQSYGGEIYTNTNVCKIVCDTEKAIAVELSNGQRIEANSFISNIHPQATIEKIASSLIRKAYRTRIGELENTISNFTVYIKFKEKSTPYLNTNFYYYDQDSVWDANNYAPAKWPENYLYMHQSSSEKQKFAESAVLIGYMRYDEVKKWKNTKHNQRGDEYEKFKLEKTKKILEKLERSFPGVNACIENVYTSSPLTYEEYTATKEGSMYGIVRDKNFPTQTLISQRTKIPNLFLTGQNINSHGILGVTIGAMITCAEYIGMNTIINQIDEAN